MYCDCPVNLFRLFRFIGMVRFVVLPPYTSFESVHPAHPVSLNVWFYHHCGLDHWLYLDFGLHSAESKSATFDVVPPQMSKPITLTFTLQNDTFLAISNGSLILTKTGGTMLKLPIPDWTSNYTENKKWTHDYVVTIPANTSLASGKFTISFSDSYHTYFTITQIIATY